MDKEEIKKEVLKEYREKPEIYWFDIAQVKDFEKIIDKTLEKTEKEKQEQVEELKKNLCSRPIKNKPCDICINCKEINDVFEEKDDEDKRLSKIIKQDIDETIRKQNKQEEKKMKGGKKENG